MDSTTIKHTKHYTDFFDQHPQAAFILVAGEIIDCNQSACDLFHLSDKREVIEQNLEDVFESLGFCSKEWLQRHLDLDTIHSELGLIDAVSITLPVTAAYPGSFHCHFKPAKSESGLCYLFIDQGRDVNELPENDAHLLQLGSRQIKLSCDELITFVSTLFLHFEVGIKVYELESRNIVAANQTLLDMLGYNEAELFGLPVDSLIPDMARDKHQNALKGLAEKGYHDAYQKHLKDAQGCLHSVSVLGSILSKLNHQHYVWTFIAKLSAIEEQNQLLLKREQRLKFAQKQSKMGNWELDLVNNRLYWSDQVYRIFELDKAQFEPSYELFLDAIHPDDREAVKAAYEQSLLDKAPYSIRHRLQMPDGRVKYVYENCETEFDNSGRPLLSLGTIQDISVAHQSQQELANLARIVQTSKDFIGMANPDGRITFINEAGRKMINFEGNLATEKWFIPDLYIERDQAQIQQVLIPSLLDQGEWRGELKLKVGGSEAASILTFCDCFRIDDNLSGQPLYLACVSQNISEKRAAEIRLEEYHNRLEMLVEQRTHELVRAREQAISANRAKSEFLSRVSHELRTPLNAVLGFAQILSYELDPSQPVQQDHIAEILGAGHHLLDMINDILDLSEIEIGKISLDYQPVLLSDLLAKCIDSFLLLHPMKVLPLQIVSLDDVRVMIDQKRFSQIVANVLSNSVKFSEGCANILISAGPVDAHTFQVSLLNTALHLSAEQMAQAFLPFERLSESFDLVQGSGIGLALSKELSQCLGGKIWLEHVSDQGTACVLRLPIGTAVQEDTKPLDGHIPPEKKRYTLLYIEDNNTNMSLMRRFLSKFPEFNLMEARSAAEGFEILERSLPDLILLDLSLPDRDGILVYETLRNTSRTATLPVIAVTANAMNDDVKYYQAIGFDDCYFKPLDYPKLIQAIRNQLNKHGA